MPLFRTISPSNALNPTPTPLFRIEFALKQIEIALLHAENALRIGSLKILDIRDVNSSFEGWDSAIEDENRANEIGFRSIEVAVSAFEGKIGRFRRIPRARNRPKGGASALVKQFPLDFILRRTLPNHFLYIMLSLRTFFIVMLALGSAGGTSAALGASTAGNRIEELTSPEVQARIAAGATTILIPIGGTEQNGPYMTLGKHNARVSYFAAAIAQGLGNALVAPVIAYVPEGAVSPPAAHMRFAGTISISEAAFESMLEGTARSFKQHGFRDVVFLGDHGGYQKNLEHVAERLTKEWARDPACRVHAYTGYYQASQAPFIAALKSRGYSATEIGTHAGLADTALTLATAPQSVRTDRRSHAPQPGPADGVQGDPRRATAALGQAGAAQIIQTSVAGIAQLTRRPHLSQQ